MTGSVREYVAAKGKNGKVSENGNCFEPNKVEKNGIYSVLYKIKKHQHLLGPFGISNSISSYRVRVDKNLILYSV